MLSYALAKSTNATYKGVLASLNVSLMIFCNIRIAVSVDLFTLNPCCSSGNTSDHSAHLYILLSRMYQYALSMRDCNAMPRAELGSDVSS